MTFDPGHPLPLELLHDSAAELGDSPSLISVVVPLFNEEATVASLYDEVRAALEGEGVAWELVYVDDGSTDGSHRELVRLHAAHTNVRVVRLRRNFGKAAALSSGFERPRSRSTIGRASTDVRVMASSGTRGGSSIC